jgi:hypothetical protein
MKNQTTTNALQDALNALTPEEWTVVTQSTAKDWVDALARLVVKPDFWAGIATAALEGVNQGVEDYLDADY